MSIKVKVSNVNPLLDVVSKLMEDKIQLKIKEKEIKIVQASTTGDFLFIYNYPAETGSFTSDSIMAYGINFMQIDIATKDLLDEINLLEDGKESVKLIIKDGTLKMKGGKGLIFH